MYSLLLLLLLLLQVTFNLHPSFKDPVRKVEQQPFELTETGWGEFDIGVVVSTAAHLGPYGSTGSSKRSYRSSDSRHSRHLCS
jgi:hypothetical protein